MLMVYISKATNCAFFVQSDLWSCGITAIEMAEGAPRTYFYHLYVRYITVMCSYDAGVDKTIIFFFFNVLLFCHCIARKIYLRLGNIFVSNQEVGAGCDTCIFLILKILSSLCKLIILILPSKIILQVWSDVFSAANDVVQNKYPELSLPHCSTAHHGEARHA